MVRTSLAKSYHAPISSSPKLIPLVSVANAEFIGEEYMYWLGRYVALSLEILLQPAGASASASASGAAAGSSNSTIVIAENADTTKTDSSVKTKDNTTYYEHSINYAIPKTLTPGQYQVVFLDKTTNTQLDIPIEIRPASAASSSLSASATGSDASGPSSIFAGAPSSKDFGLAAKTLLALAAVAGVALML